MIKSIRAFLFCPETTPVPTYKLTVTGGAGIKDINPTVKYLATGETQEIKYAVETGYDTTTVRLTKEGGCSLDGNTVTMGESDCTVRIDVDKNKYKVSGSISPAGAEEAQGATKLLPIEKKVDHGNSATLTAPTLEGWTFKGWNTTAVTGEGNCTASVDTTDSHKLQVTNVTGDCGYNASYEEIKVEEPETPTVNKIKVHFRAETSGTKSLGYVSNSDNEIEIGEVVSSTATPNTGYRFKNWTKLSGNCELADNTTLNDQTIKVKAAGTIECTYLARFEQGSSPKTTVEFWVNNTNVGTMTINGTTTDGTNAHKSISVTPGTTVDVSAAVTSSTARFDHIQVQTGSCTFENSDTAIRTLTGKLTAAGDKCQVMAYINPSGGSSSGYKFNLCVEPAATGDQAISYRWNKTNPTNIYASGTIDGSSLGSSGGSTRCADVTIPASPISVQFRDLTNYGKSPGFTPAFYHNKALGGPNGSEGSLMAGGYYEFNANGLASSGCDGQIVNNQCTGNVYFIKTVTINSGDTIYFKRWSTSGMPSTIP